MIRTDEMLVETFLNAIPGTCSISCVQSVDVETPHVEAEHAPSVLLRFNLYFKLRCIANLREW
jgi:hypothetical protein